MNAFKRIKWFFANRIYPSSDIIGYLVSSFIDEGKLVKENDFYAFIEYKDSIYKIWIENYPYAWLSKCESIPKEKYEFEYSIGETVWNKTVPPKKVAMKFEDWMYKERKRLFDEQNSIKETDNTHQTNLKETAMSNETSYEFKTFDHVLVRDDSTEEWNPDIFIRFVPENEDGDKVEYPYITLASHYRYCIPYNEEKAFTKDVVKANFKEGDTVEFIYLRRDKWFRGTITEVSTKEKKGDNYIYRVDFVDEDGDKDWVWCKLDQLREACVNVDSEEEEEEEEENASVDPKFKEGEKVWYRGDYSGDKWTTGTVVAIDRHDPVLTYHIKLFINDMTWWVGEDTLKKIDDNPL